MKLNIFTVIRVVPTTQRVPLRGFVPEGEVLGLSGSDFVPDRDFEASVLALGNFLHGVFGVAENAVVVDGKRGGGAVDIVYSFCERLVEPGNSVEVGTVAVECVSVCLRPGSRMLASAWGWCV